jgi:hypothetical protein
MSDTETRCIREDGDSAARAVIRLAEPLGQIGDLPSRAGKRA